MDQVEKERTHLLHEPAMDIQCPPILHLQDA